MLIELTDFWPWIIQANELRNPGQIPFGSSPPARGLSAGLEVTPHRENHPAGTETRLCRNSLRAKDLRQNTNLRSGIQTALPQNQYTVTFTADPGRYITAM